MLDPARTGPRPKDRLEVEPSQPPSRTSANLTRRSERDDNHWQRVIDFSQRRLYAFIDTAYLRGRPAALVASQLCDGGADVIQVRAKNSTAEEVLRLTEQVKPVTDRASVALVINDYPEVARKIGADAVHLGQEDFFGAGFHRADDVTGGAAGIGLGLSSHAPEQAERAVAAKPQYIAVGPVFATPTKPGRAPVGLDYVRWAAGNLRLPWFAIGGITLANMDAVLAAGARRICVVSAVLSAPDVVRACQEFKERLASAL